jgi:uncharacterized membrane protein
VLVCAVSLLFESVGVATGLVYDPYHYTNKLGPLFLGLVPYLIPMAWFMMSYPSFVIADRLAVLSYLVTVLGIVIISLVSKAGELALIGFFAMMPWVISGWLRVAKEERDILDNSISD